MSEPTGKASVVVVTPTIMDGTVVRWYDDLYTAEAVNPRMSASRNRVLLNADLGDDPERAKELLDLAYRTRDRIRRGEDVRDMATHRHKGLFGPLVPVEKAATP